MHAYRDRVFLFLFFAYSVSYLEITRYALRNFSRSGSRDEQYRLGRRDHLDTSYSNNRSRVRDQRHVTYQHDSDERTGFTFGRFGGVSDLIFCLHLPVDFVTVSERKWLYALPVVCADSPRPICKMKCSWFAASACCHRVGCVAAVMWSR
jgi:hypothetical protein